jgi:hypothetical protein
VVDRGVDGGHVRLGEACEQGEGAGAGAAAQIHDLAGTRRDGQPGNDGRNVLCEHFRVEVEDLSSVAGIGSTSLAGTIRSEAYAPRNG